MGLIAGYLGVLTAVFCFGSNFVPIKSISVGDGVFFQFIMCNGIFATSIPVLITQGFPPIHGLALFGGFLWCTGNMCCPISIRYIGMGLGLLVWGSVGMIFGWASGTFGLFGLQKEVITYPAYNYIGVVIVIIGLFVYLQVKTNDSLDDANSKPLISERHYDGRNYRTAAMLESDDIITVGGGSRKVGNDDYMKLQLGPTHGSTEEAAQDARGQPSTAQKRLIGLTLAVIAGVFFGCSFDPAQYVNDTLYNGKDDSLNYVFPHFCGIWLTSWFYTIVYFVYKYSQGEEPFLNPKCILPATISGVMWGIAEIAWFVANGQLGFSISFPIISAGPGFVGALWGVLVFKEITGFKNLTTLVIAALITLPALVLIGISH